MKHTIFLSILALFLINMVEAQDNIFQLWNTNSVKVALSENSSLNISEKMQYVTESGKISSKYGDITVYHRLNNRLEAGVGGRFLKVAKSDGWLDERRAMLYGNLNKDVGQFKLYFSNRLEYRTFPAAKNHFRHWQTFSAEADPFKSNRIKLYLAEETFTLFSNENLTGVRGIAGVKLICSSYFIMKLYYVHEKKRATPKWSGSDILGLNLYLVL